MKTKDELKQDIEKALKGSAMIATDIDWNMEDGKMSIEVELAKLPDESQLPTTYDMFDYLSNFHGEGIVNNFTENIYKQRAELPDESKVEEAEYREVEENTDEEEKSN